MFGALWSSSSSKSNDNHTPSTPPSSSSSTTTTATTIASENISASYHDAAARKHATNVKSELSYAGDHIQSAASHAAASVSHAIAEGQAGIKAEINERQLKAEKERKDALEDTYRTPQFSALTGHYNDIFQMKPFINHRVAVRTPDIMNTKGGNYFGWQWIPTLRFGADVTQSSIGSPHEDVIIDSTLTANNTNKSLSSTIFSIGAPISNPWNAWMYSATSLNNNDNGMGLSYSSMIDQNRASASIGFRPGPRSPSLALQWQMVNNNNTINNININNGERNHQFSIASSHCLYRNPRFNESLTGGLGVTTKPMITCKTMDHRSLESIGAAFRYSIQNELIAASIHLDPYTAKVQGGQMQVASTQRLSSTSDYPQYSVGMTGGMVALNPLIDRSHEKFTRADFDTDAIFTSTAVSKPLLIGDLLYRPSPSLRYGARITSDFGVCLMYQHTLQKNFQIQAAISNGVKGIHGSAAQQGSIMEPVFAPTVAIGLTLDGNE